MTVAVALPTLGLSDDDAKAMGRLRGQLAKRRRQNKIFYDYYEAANKIRDLGISIPPHLVGVEVAAGLAATGVDVLDERLDWLGWRASDGDLMGLDEVYRDNRLNIESDDITLDSLIAGISFAEVGSGGDGEPETLVTGRSPRHCTINWDSRKRRVADGLAQTKDDRGRVEFETYFKPDETIVVSRSGSKLTIEDRIEHGMGIPALVRFANRRRASRDYGRSEITRPVRYYTDAAVRTILGMEVNREFYNAPQRYILGADEESFVDADGKNVSMWEAIQGRMLAIGRDDSDELPTVGQFASSSPQPYIEQIKLIFQLAAAEMGIPATYLGFVTENPSSADAIARAEIRLIKRAERRQDGLGAGWLDVAKLCLLWRDGNDFDLSRLRNISSKWTNAATPTRSAAADDATKLIGSGVLLPDSTVTYDRVGLDPEEQDQLAREKQSAAGGRLLDRVLSARDEQQAAAAGSAQDAEQG